MAVGDRIKRVRNFRGMTMKELGMAVGFDEKSADVRVAQYENNSRKPKEELMRKIAAALDVSVAYLEDPTMNDAEGILHALFELDDQYPWMHLVETVDNTDADLPHKRVAVCFDYNILDSFMAEWMLRKQQGDHPRGISGMEAELAFHRRRLRKVQTEKSVEKRIKT